jgi:hypothetical protein
VIVWSSSQSISPTHRPSPDVESIWQVVPGTQWSTEEHELRQLSPSHL